MAFIVVKNCLHLLKGMTVKLQKRDIDIIEAYRMINDTKNKIKNLRTNLDKEHQGWFKEAQEMAEKLGAEISIPRITQSGRHFRA